MNGETFQAFGDELEKIAILGHLKNYLHEGWHGTEENPNTWLGRGVDIKPGMGRVGRAWQHLSSLNVSPKTFPGGVTKALPVGMKSQMALFAIPEAMSAMKKNDPSGQGMSRTERVARVAGSTVGGLIGGTAGSKALGFGGGMAGGIGGSILGAKVLSAPFSAMRKRRQAAQAAAAVQQPPMQYGAG